MNNEYIIINKTTIQQRIEELKKPTAHHDGIYVSDEQVAEYEALEKILSQSTPLIPEIEKAFNESRKYDMKNVFKWNDSKDYISNLKLDI